MTHPLPQNDPGSIDLIDAEADSVPAPEPHRPKGFARFLLGASLVLIAFNLRPVFSSASALLPEIRDVLGLSPTGASLLTTLPVVCLGLFSPPRRMPCSSACTISSPR